MAFLFITCIYMTISACVRREGHYSLCIGIYDVNQPSKVSQLGPEENTLLLKMRDRFCLCGMPVLSLHSDASGCRSTVMWRCVSSKVGLLYIFNNMFSKAL